MLITMKSLLAGQHLVTGASIVAYPGETIDLPTKQAKEIVAGGYADDTAAKEKADKETEEKARADRLKAKEEAAKAGGQGG